MSPRTVLSDQQLIEYSGEHLLYELQIFAWIVANFPPEASFCRSVFLESFAIHLRNLIDFFYTSPAIAREDDIVGADFFDSPDEWNPRVVPRALEAARQRANKEVSHITYKRKAATDETKPWPVSDLFREVDAVARKFVAGASRKKLHAHVVKFLTTPKVVATSMLDGASTASSNTAVIDSIITPLSSGRTLSGGPSQAGISSRSTK